MKAGENVIIKSVLNYPMSKDNKMLDQCKGFYLHLNASDNYQAKSRLNKKRL
jgi:hypothetical protein